MHLNKAWIANSGFPNLALICGHLFSPPLLTNVLGIKISKILRYMKKRRSKADKMLYSFDSLAYVYASKRKTSSATVRFGATCDGSWNHGRTIGAAEFQPGCTLLTWWHQPTVKRQYIIIRVYKKTTNTISHFATVKWRKWGIWFLRTTRSGGLFVGSWLDFLHLNLVP